jgi:hypothetical protein
LIFICRGKKKTTKKRKSTKKKPTKKSDDFIKGDDQEFNTGLSLFGSKDDLMFFEDQDEELYANPMPSTSSK